MEQNLGLTRREIHFLSQLLFYVNNSVSLSLGDANEAADLQKKIDRFLVNEEDFHSAVSCESGDCYCDDDDEQEKDFPVQPDELVNVVSLLGCGKFKATNEEEETCKVEFVESGDGCLDLDVNDGNEIIDNITMIERGGKHFDVFSSGVWFRFDCQKFPKQLTSVIKPNLIYGIKLNHSRR